MSESSDANFGFGMSLEGRTLQGHYRMETLVARGGMAWLYKATHLILQETMAVKLLYPQLAERPKIRARFVDEAKIQFRLRHPHIVQVTDVIQDGNLIGSVMEWVDGEDAKEYIKRRGEPLSLPEIWDICHPILDALHYAHQLGLVHRDIKPANILLHWEGTQMTPKLSDFGIAKVVSEAQEGQTATGATLGTMAYIAPEQIQDSKRVDVRADIYSLGVTLYHMATGTLPFRGGLEVLIYKQMYETPPPPSDIAPHISPGLNDIILRCLHKSPEMRFQNCMELSFALSSLISQRNQENLAFKATMDMPIFDGGGGVKPTAENRPFVHLPTPISMALEEEKSALSSVDISKEAHSSLTPPPSPTSSEDGRLESKKPATPEKQSHNKATLFLEEDEHDVAGSAFPPKGLWVGLFVLLLLVVIGGWWQYRAKVKEGSQTSEANQVGALPVQASNRHSGSQPNKTNRNGGPVVVEHRCRDGQRRPCYNGPPKTLGRGQCRAGLQVCRSGNFGPCQGERKPSTLELCNGRDDDCDGAVDEDFARKGHSCTQRVGTCLFRGTLQCHRSQKSLYCRSTGRLRNKYASPVRLHLRPRGRRFSLKFGTRRIRVRNFTCLEVTTKIVVSVEAHGFQLCTFSLRPHRRTLRLRLKRKAMLEPPPGYCLSR